MEHPVYPFRAVLRELRRDAGLTILAAAEATGYGKYERWESGQTKVGGQYLRSIAEAFAITDELHLLLYAWVLDQLTPDGGSARRLDLDELRSHVRLAPETVIDLHEHKALVREPGRHVDLALLCLAARYADRRLVVLPAVDRRELPPRAPGTPILEHLYGDVVHDGTAAMGRALLVRGIDKKPPMPSTSATSRQRWPTRAPTSPSPTTSTPSSRRPTSRSSPSPPELRLTPAGSPSC